MVRSMRKTTRTSRARLGFTLIEALVIVIIIGVLVGLVVPRLFSRVGQAKSKVAQQKMVSIEQAIEMFRYDYERFPRTLQELVTQPSDIDADTWTEPSLRAKDLIDPWGNPFVYRFPGTRAEFDLMSLGADGQEGGENEDQDITINGPARLYPGRDPGRRGHHRRVVDGDDHAAGRVFGVGKAARDGAASVADVAVRTDLRGHTVHALPPGARP